MSIGRADNSHGFPWGVRAWAGIFHLGIGAPFMHLLMEYLFLDQGAVWRLHARPHNSAHPSRRNRAHQFMKLSRATASDATWILNNKYNRHTVRSCLALLCLKILYLTYLDVILIIVLTYPSCFVCME
jgi:hypothetical protein